MYMLIDQYTNRFSEYYHEANGTTYLFHCSLTVLLTCSTVHRSVQNLLDAGT